MYTDSRKIHIIEALLHIKDERILSAIEQVIDEVANASQKKSAKKFLGIWNETEGAAIEKAVEEGCEQIHPDDWK